MHAHALERGWPEPFRPAILTQAVWEKELSKLETISLAIKNLRRSVGLRAMPTGSFKSFQIRAMKRADAVAINDLYASYEGEHMNQFSRLVLSLTAGRLCAVATNRDGAIIGFEHFYFNHRDMSEGTVHEGYIAVRPEFGGIGIASAMRSHCLKHFRQMGVLGVSTRISHNNTASMASATKSGFKPVEQYVDPHTHEVRSYLIAPLD